MSSSPSEPTRLSTFRWALVLTIAAVGFLFDTYELLMFPVIGTNSIAELYYRVPVSQLTPEQQIGVREWAGRMLWIAALCGGSFGLLGGWLIDRLGRKKIMVASILAYSISPVCAAYSTELWHLVLFRCTTFIGVCVEMVAAVTWLAELFTDKRSRELAIGWTLATASLGGILVTAAFKLMVANAKQLPDLHFPAGHLAANVAWRFTLLTGLIPGAVILLLMPFVPESEVWRRKRREGTLHRPSFGELFSPALRRTTFTTTILSACGYAAAFGAIQLTPLQIIGALPEVAAQTKQAKAKMEAAKSQAEMDEAKKVQEETDRALADRRGNIQLWQEIGGLVGRILLAILLLFVPSRILIRLFLVPGLVLFPITYFQLVHKDYTTFAIAIFFCGLLTVAQFSFLSEFLPRVYPLHLRGTGGSFATNFGGRMIGTMAATLNTEWLSKQFTGSPPMQVAQAAGVIGGSVYLIALIASFLLPSPAREEAKQAQEFGRDEALDVPKGASVER